MCIRGRKVCIVCYSVYKGEKSVYRGESVYKGERMCIRGRRVCIVCYSVYKGERVCIMGRECV